MQLQGSAANAVLNENATINKTQRIRTPPLLRQLPSILVSYGIKLKPRGNRYEALCPAHPSDSPTLSIYRIDGKWECYCMTCGLHEDAIGFVSKIEDCSPSEAIDKIKAIKGQHQAPIIRKPVIGQKCGAKTRQGRPCIANAMPNGKCRNHGGLSTGPRTEAGLSKAKLNLRIMWNPITRAAHKNPTRIANKPITEQVPEDTRAGISCSSPR